MQSYKHKATRPLIPSKEEAGIEHRLNRDFCDSFDLYESCKAKEAVTKNRRHHHNHQHLAGKFNILHFSFGAGTDWDHIEDILEMVGDLVAAVATGLSGPFDDRFKMPELGVFQHFGHISGAPEIISVFILPLDLFKNRRLVG